MCTTVTTPSGDWLQSVTELRAAGITVTDDQLDGGDADHCLCSIDVEAVLDANGLTYTTADGGGFYDLATEPGAATTPQPDA